MGAHLRILAIAPTGFFADYGCHVRIRGHMAALKKRGHQVRIVTYPGGRDVDGLVTVRPLLWPRHRDMPVGSSWQKLLLDALLAPTSLSAALRSYQGGKPDLVHAYLHEGALIGVLLSHLLSIPLVFDFQGSLTAEMVDHGFLGPRSLFYPLFRAVEGWIDRRPHAILASSCQASQLLEEQFGVSPGRVACLPDTVDPAAFQPRDPSSVAAVNELRARLPFPHGEPLLVYLGLLAPYQGTELLLQALRLLVERGLAFRCLIMGFPHVDRYRGLATELGLSQRVIFTGAIPYEEAPLYLALGDLALAPKLSATEGSGKLLTYMAVGLPVVAFDSPVHREYLGDLGIYAPAGDPAGLASAIEQALRNPDDACQRGRRLRQRVVDNYTWDHAASHIELVYKRLLEAG